MAASRVGSIFSACEGHDESGVLGRWSRVLAVGDSDLLTYVVVCDSAFLSGRHVGSMVGRPRRLLV
jgi:hypothetical protein